MSVSLIDGEIGALTFSTTHNDARQYIRPPDIRPPAVYPGLQADNGGAGSG